MAKQPGFRDVEERLKEISADGDPLETLAGAVDFERFRPILKRAAGKPPGPKGGRPALDVVPEFRMLVLQSFNRKFRAILKPRRLIHPSATMG